MTRKKRRNNLIYFVDSGTRPKLRTLSKSHALGNHLLWDLPSLGIFAGGDFVLSRVFPTGLSSLLIVHNLSCPAQHQNLKQQRREQQFATHRIAADIDPKCLLWHPHVFTCTAHKH
jgi:hypothetical protein